MAVRQGPAFILLSAVLYGLYAAMPSHLQSIKDGYKEVAGQMEKSVEKLATAWEKDSSRDEAQSKAILTKLDEIKDATRANHIKQPAAKAVADNP